MSLLLRFCIVLGLLAPTFAHAMTLENPQPDSFQSGIGVISGWACEAHEIEISFDGGPRLRAATGTIREDTQGVCGDADNGFGLLYNWNRLRDGVHTVTAYADGDEFASVTVIVTTLGEEFLQGTSGTLSLPDFPTPGASRTLRWQQAQQNFVITAGSPQGGGTSGATPHILENPQPGSFQSGVGVISGWACEAQSIEISFDGGPRLQAGTGTIREDTQGVCGDTNNGFGLLYNWNRLGDGPHTVTAYADGVEFAEVTVTVTTLGAEFRRGLSREVTIPDFPEVGTDAVLQWQEAQQNFVISFAASTQRLVDVTPMLILPAGGSTPNVEISSLHSDTTTDVRASPQPTLLLAEDTGGVVLLGLANMDGGLLGEPPGEVDVSIDSTAVVLVALAAGVRLPDVDQALVDSIFAHPQWPALIAELRGLFQADPNFLDQLLNHPAVVAQIRTIGTTLSGTTSADVPPHLAAPPTFAAQGGSVLPEGERHAAFNRFSPWAAHAPWVWYGEAHPVLPTPPFLAASEAEPGLTAAGNPNFIDYALEVHHAGGSDDWYWVPSNSRLTERARDSFAAYTEIPLTEAATRVEFVRYRLDASSPRAATLSFLNTTTVILTGVGLVAKIDVIEKALKRFPLKKDSVALSRCVASLIAAARPPAPTTTRLGQAHLMIRFVVEYSKAVLEQFTSCEPLQAQMPLSRRAAIDLLVTKVVAQVALKFAGGPWSWIFIIGEALDSVVPPVLSYELPQAGSVEYQLARTQRQRSTAFDCEATLVAVSRAGQPMVDQRQDTRCHPQANLRKTDIEQDAVTQEWHPVQRAVAYKVTIASVSGDPGPLTLQTPIPVDSPVVIGETYEVAVVAFGTDGETGEAGLRKYIHSQQQPPRAIRVTGSTGTEKTLARDTAQGAASNTDTNNEARGDTGSIPVPAPPAVATPAGTGEADEVADDEESTEGERGEEGYQMSTRPMKRPSLDIRVTGSWLRTTGLEWDPVPRADYYIVSFKNAFGDKVSHSPRGHSARVEPLYEGVFYIAEVEAVSADGEVVAEAAVGFIHTPSLPEYYELLTPAERGEVGP